MLLVGMPVWVLFGLFEVLDLALFDDLLLVWGWRVGKVGGWFVLVAGLSVFGLIVTECVGFYWWHCLFLLFPSVSLILFLLKRALVVSIVIILLIIWLYHYSLAFQLFLNFNNFFLLQLHTASVSLALGTFVYFHLFDLLLDVELIRFGIICTGNLFDGRGAKWGNMIVFLWRLFDLIVGVFERWGQVVWFLIFFLTSTIFPHLNLILIKRIQHPFLSKTTFPFIKLHRTIFKTILNFQFPLSLLKLILLEIKPTAFHHLELVLFLELFQRLEFVMFWLLMFL